MLLAASTSDLVPGGMCVTDLSPAPAPKVTPAGSRLVPVLSLHVAPWLVSNCARQPGHMESWLLARPRAWHSWEMPRFPPSGAHTLAKGPQ